MTHSTCSSACKGQSQKAKNKPTSLLSLLLIIVLPNCPFCIMAYSSAITMCGGPDMYMAENNWASYLPITLSMVIIAIIWINKRGKRTTYALLSAMVGAMLIVLVHQLILAEAFYYLGTTLLFVGILINSSFVAVYHALKRKLFGQAQSIS